MFQRDAPSFKAWLLFIILSFIWGSSFILMKIGLFGIEGHAVLSAFDVGALRIAGAGIVLLPFALKAWRKIKSRKDGLLALLSGLLGSFFPAFLFCIAETRISSAFAGFINSITPLFAILIAAFFYHARVPTGKWLGIFTGLAGSVLLFWDAHAGIGRDFTFGFYALLATIFYAINVNMVKEYLTHIKPLSLAAIALTSLFPLAIAVLSITGFFHLDFTNRETQYAVSASLLLGVIGTAIASVLFYELVKISGVIFSSLVTYGIPFIALGWGLVLGESISTMQVIALLVILIGVYAVNKPGISRRPKIKKAGTHSSGLN